MIQRGLKVHVKLGHWLLILFQCVIIIIKVQNAIVFHLCTFAKNDFLFKVPRGSPCVSPGNANGNFKTWSQLDFASQKRNHSVTDNYVKWTPFVLWSRRRTFPWQLIVICDMVRKYARAFSTAPQVIMEELCRSQKKMFSRSWVFPNSGTRHWKCGTRHCGTRHCGTKSPALRHW